MSIPFVYYHVIRNELICPVAIVVLDEKKSKMCTYSDMTKVSFVFHI